MRTYRPPCILVVTDEPLIRHMVARLLASEGYVPLVAEGGEADFGSLAGACLALVLINTYRPDLNGTEAVARVSAAFRASRSFTSKKPCRGPSTWKA